MTALPSFEDVFAAAHRGPGRAAFPWQRRLTREILNGQWLDTVWPRVLDLPTGVGKTSALDIALYCLAAAPERMPRRIVLVVDRRIVVDQGALHARELQRAMTDATDGPLAAMASRLRGLWDGKPGEPPFEVAVMRGGMPRDNDWARRPDQPVLGVSTVDQLGSRLLFRGYGVSPRSASIHAGLVGNDTLILLDEVHLANAFAALLDTIHVRFRGASAQLPQRFVVVRMSATIREPSTARAFSLDDADRADPTLAVRLGATKHAALRTVKVSGDDEGKKLEAVASRAVQEALALQATGARVVAIVVNRVDTARIASQLLEQHKATDAVLVTGRMRPIDRDHVVRTSLLPRAGASRARASDDRPLIVVATQCIEAGADLDFDAMVTECASLDALRQRFGRVDRRGQLASSDSIILCRSDQAVEASTDPIYGVALGATWRWLIAHAGADRVDFGIAALPTARDGAGDPLGELLPPVADPPVLLPAHLDAWAQTSQLPMADPDIALWLHGPARPSADVQVIWRVNSDVATLDDEQLEGLIERLQACRPSALEAITVPLAAVRRWLDGQPVETIADVEGATPDEAPARHQSPLPAAKVLRWVGDNSEPILPRQLRPGDVVVLDTTRGGVRKSSFDPGVDRPDAVVDLGDLAQLRGRAIATLRLQREALTVWHLPAYMLDTVPAPVRDEAPDERNARVIAWLKQWPESTPEDFVGTQHEWHAMRAALQSRPRISVVGDQLIVTAPAKLSADAVHAVIDDAVSEDDDSSFRQAEVTLTAHSTDVRDHAAQYARALGFDAAIVADLALAGWLHDVGKADPRFQRWLVGGSEVSAAEHDQVLAKSALPPGSARERRLARQRAGYPRGYRHELLSLAMAQGHEVALRAAHDRDLVLHLVASHHGWCRPFPPPVADHNPVDVLLQHGEHAFAATTDHKLARIDSDVAPRFWRLVKRYGWWGLAWLEAVIRLADHRASEQPTTAEAP